jgi:hypothetical protein
VDVAKVSSLERLATLLRRHDPSALSLLDFVPRVTPNFTRPDHLTDLAGMIEACEANPIRACVSVPPRHSKTETVLHGIARYLRKHPDRTVAYVSYAADIARSKSRQAFSFATTAQPFTSGALRKVAGYSRRASAGRSQVTGYRF